MSKLELAIEWGSPIVYAGEDIKCTITFTNTTRLATVPTAAASGEQSRGPGSARERWKADLPSQPSSANSVLPRSSEAVSADSKPRGHRPTLSLNVPVKNASRPGSVPSSARSVEGHAPSKAHKRSVSILSIGAQSASTEESDGRNRTTAADFVKNSHSRSESAESSFQTQNGRLTSPQLPHSAPPPRTTGPRRPETLPAATFKRTEQLPKHATTLGSRPGAEMLPPPIPSVTSSDSLPPNGSENTGRNSLTSSNSRTVDGVGLKRHPSRKTGRPPAASISADPSHRSLQRLMSPPGGESTPRSSMDLYSHSNHSSETLQSEYVPPATAGRPLLHRRDGSQLGIHHAESETLMMGYVQLVGSFTLEGSLVNMAPFEAVKRKAIIGGHGSGGVVGVEAAKRDSGLLGSLSWNSFGQSLGGLLGSEEPSSFREMKGIASSKSIPIISTAQSILFVDLQLRPGESRRFTYSHPLPRGIPPTFKGRAIKCNYQLVVGTQRAQRSRAQQAGRPQHSVRQIDVPFKVQPSVNESGEILGHDLMNPHIVLKDMSNIEALDSADVKPRTPTSSLKTAAEGDAEFAFYVKELLDKSGKENDTVLLSPTSSMPPPHASALSHPHSPQAAQAPIKELIDMAIAQQTAPGATRNSSSSLQISRDGEKVAKVLLARTAFRVGETIAGTVDFTGADVACFTFNAFLESAEVVDPTIALRSSASIHRATRRIHAQMSENTLCAERIAFALTIPPSATPDFLTSGVKLEWKLRLEFVTADVRSDQSSKPLLHINEKDDRGVFCSGDAELPYQSFEVPVSLRIYGSIGAGESDTLLQHGYRI